MRREDSDRALDVVAAYYAYPFVALFKVLIALVLWSCGGMVVLGVISLLRRVLGV